MIVQAQETSPKLRANSQLFQNLAKSNFQQDYTSESFPNVPIDPVHLQETKLYSPTPKININRFEGLFSANANDLSQMFPNTGQSHLSTSLNGKLGMTKLTHDSSSYSRHKNRAAFFLQDDNQTDFQSKIKQENSFCFKSLPRKCMESKEVEQTEERLKQILRKEDYKYTVSPLVRQDGFDPRAQNRLECQSLSAKEKALFQTVDFDKLRSRHDNRDTSDLKQKDLWKQLQNYKDLKQCKQERGRQERVMQQQFKSGVMGVDGPLGESTTYYQQEQQRLLDTHASNQKRQQKHKQIMAQTLGTHHFIDISNYYNNQRRGQEEELVVPVQKYDGEVVMKGKQHPQIDYKEYFKKETNYSGNQMRDSHLQKGEQRQKYLQSQHRRGKSYDIVSNNNLH